MAGARPFGGDRLVVPVVRDGQAVELVLDAATLARVEERPGSRLAERLAGQIAVPPGAVLNVVEDPSGIAIAWPTLPPNRDLAREDISGPAVLRLVLP